MVKNFTLLLFTVNSNWKNICFKNLDFIFSNLNYACVHEHTIVYICMHVRRYQKRPKGSDPLELELQAVDVNQLTGVLGTELWPLPVVQVLNH